MKKMTRMTDFGEVMRKCTRPIVTIIFAAVIAQVIAEGIDIPWEQWVLLSGVILWWFGDRTRGHIKDKGVDIHKEALKVIAEMASGEK